MKFPKPYTLKEIANLINSEYVGQDNAEILGTNEIHRVEKGDIVFVDHPKYYDKALNSAATTILINKKVDCPEGKSLLISDDPFRDFNKINRYFNAFIPSSTTISPTAKIGEHTIIQPNTFIGNQVIIGKNCIIHSNVSIYDGTIIGDNVIIHAGTVLGSDGFYYKTRPNEYDKLLSVGNVVIEDHVEIGANCTIDKGVTSATRIGEGSKLDNLIQVGHDTIIGKRCLIASQVGIAGCCIIGDEVKIWGQVGIKASIVIEDKVEIYAQSGVGKDLKEGKTYFGSPADDARLMMKQLIFLKKSVENHK